MASGERRGTGSPDLAALGRWLLGWVQADGAIHGVHGSAVTGHLPGPGDDCGHSAFAAPLAAALGTALQSLPDERGQELLGRLLDFQLRDRQDNGQYAHLGGPEGEARRDWLLPNMLVNASLCTVARVLREDLDDALRRRLGQGVAANLEACDRLYGVATSLASTGAEEYARNWARLLYMEAFQTDTWDQPTRASLAFLREHFLAPGMPDADCAGLLTSPERPAALEFADACGYALSALALAHRRYGDAACLADAQALARHLGRGSWCDRYRHRRLARHWLRTPAGDWEPCQEPMLIGGMGLTLYGLQTLYHTTGDAEIGAFLDDLDRTYACCQTPAGFFLPGSGWWGPADLIPDSAVQSHDFWYLVTRHSLKGGFWDRLFASSEVCTVLAGQHGLWLEDRQGWALRGYEGFATAALAGRKDRARNPAGEAAGGDAGPAAEPRFRRSDTCIYFMGGRQDLQLYLSEPFGYQGPAQPGHCASQAGPLLPAPWPATTTEPPVPDLLTLLGGIELFHPLTHEERRRLASRLRPRQLAPDEVLIRQGDAGDSMFILGSGQCEVLVAGQAGGERCSLAMMHPGDFAGEMSVLTGEQRSATVVARTPVQVWEVTREVLGDLLAQRPEVALGISRIVAERRLRTSAALAVPPQAVEGVAAQLIKRIGHFLGSAGKPQP